jgi:membrane-bound lytic murein transglycosylase D
MIPYQSDLPKLRYVFFSVFLLFLSILCGGCATHFQNASVSEDAILLSEEKKILDNSVSMDCENVPDDNNIPDTDNSPDDKKNGGVKTPSLTSPGVETRAILDEALDFCHAAQDFWQKGELENAIQALDQAYSLILNVDTFDIPKLTQQKEDLRFTISKRILEIYASRNIVVNGNHNAIPITINKHVQTEINRFTVKERSFFIQSYKRSGSYRPYIVAALKEAGLPVELSWLPLIESGFKVRALSSARALGLWQFIPSTGYKFGLKRDMYIDERLDPVKATKAAIAYLKELHQIFGDWTTVLAAYNCGEGRVLRIIRKQKINYLDNFWDLYERLPLETARYVPRFLATLHIVKNLKTYGFDSLSVDPPFEYETLSVSKQIHLKDIAGKIKVPSKLLKELNPELRYNMLPDNEYPLKLPVGKKELLLAKIDEIPVSYKPRPAVVYHRVRPGQTLSTIAGKYHTNIKSIARANNIHKKNYIVAGKILKIPQNGTFIAKKYGQTSIHAVKKGPSLHTVKRGDSLWVIAKNYGTTTQKIQELNKLTTTGLHIGQVLKISGYPPKRDNKLKTYLVKRGDNPFTIARVHHMPIDRLLRINRLSARSKIYPGQKLYIE